MGKFQRVFLGVVFCAGTVFAKSFAGPYIDLGYGMASLHDAGYYRSAGNNHMGAFKIAGGGYINRYFAVELEYFKMQNANATKTDGSSESFGYSALTVNTVLHYYLYKDRIDLRAKFGVGQSSLSITSNAGAALVYGGGLGYMITPRYSVGVNYDMYKFDYNSASRGSFSMGVDAILCDVKMKF